MRTGVLYIHLKTQEFFFLILYSAQLEKVVFTSLQGHIHKWKESCRRTWSIHKLWPSQYASQIYFKKNILPESI